MIAFPRKNQLAPSLPCEIVQEIFILCLPPLETEWGGYTDNPKHHPPAIGVPVRLSHVSRAWRSIAHATPLLWTDVCVHNPSPQRDAAVVKHVLQYSTNRPINVCMVVDGYKTGYIDCDNEMEPEYMEYLGTHISELFRHADRMRSFRMFFKHWVRLWGDSVFIPPLPRLEELKISVYVGDRSIRRLFPLFNSPRLQKVSWLCPDYPEPLNRMGAQIKQLVCPDLACFDDDDEQTTALLRACPNLIYLDAHHDGPPMSHSAAFVSLPALHTFRSSDIGLHACVAPNLRHLTLECCFEVYGRIRLAQFLNQSPQLEHLSLDLSGYRTPDDLVSELAPLTPRLVALKLTLQTIPDAPSLDQIFELFTHTAHSALTPALPELQNFTLDIRRELYFRQKLGPLVYDPEILLRMMESRCNNCGQDAVAVLRSYTMNYEDDKSGLINDAPLSRMAGAKERLEVLEGRGLVLGGNTFAAILGGSRLA
ncbi:hypothetical protein BJ138DRAFT_779167 [Hygrophoropsis aurantiaca]|uniref:Uncharacterized protein n=1 Tax=Hygrophoropsis aurantiaca TaxID=72124 RepID=A0ACB8AG84_9AGAM|nr:hypothetical protein BJ138DRAFT_779167 [Hygrophoropsis aurantiaca]